MLVLSLGWRESGGVCAPTLHCHGVKPVRQRDKILQKKKKVLFFSHHRKSVTEAHRDEQN
jgi:hypothetical protein